MSESRKSYKGGFDNSLTDRFRKLNSSDRNKPDSPKEFNHLGSPVSPLTSHRRRSTSSGITPTTTTSSSSGSSGSLSGTKTTNTRNTPLKTSSSSPVSDNKNGCNNNSGELSVCSENSPTTSETVRSIPTSNVRSSSSKHGHLRSYSGNVSPLIYSGGGITTSNSNNSSGGGGGGSTVNSPNNNTFLPTGNICPCGKIVTTGMACKNSSRNVVLGSGSGNYGHGSIMKGGGGGGVLGKSNSGGGGDFIRKAMVSLDPEEVKRAGNEEYSKGHFLEALNLYDRAISISPGNAAFHSYRAAALTGLGRLVEAIKEYEEAVRLDPGYGRAHQRLACLHLRFGHVENARTHLTFPGQQQSDPSTFQKLQEVERHLTRCANARKIGDWKSALREGDAAIVAGVDSSCQLFACRTEALLKLHQLEEAEKSVSKIPDKIEQFPVSCSQPKFFGMLAESYIYFVRSQIELAFGRFENAVAAAEKACQIDPRSIEVTVMLKNVKLVAKARSLGNDLFKAGNFVEACSTYGDGLKIDPSNSVLYCNRAACWWKLGQWEKSVEDCNQTLRFQPKYTKALLRRASSNDQLQRWVESVRDYEGLRRELPENKEVAESLFRAQVSLKKSRGEEIHNLKFGGEVEEISDLDQLRAAISSPSVSVVHFMAPSNQQCEQISPYIDTLCSRFPSVNFLKVDIKESPALAKEENVSIVPTFKIYKNCRRIKEMICPSYQVLEQSVRHYSL